MTPRLTGRPFPGPARWSSIKLVFRPLLVLLLATGTRLTADQTTSATHPGLQAGTNAANGARLTADQTKSDTHPGLQAGTNAATGSPPPASKTAISSALVTAEAHSGATNSMDVLDNKHRLAIGDRLSFRIVEDDEDPKPLYVTDSGDLEVPYIGRFPAEGKTCKELAVALKAALEKEYYFQATVIVAVDLMAKSRGKVYLVGPVHTPGPLEIPSDEVFTLSKAILRAGGFTDFANKNNVRVTRKANGAAGRDQTFIVDVKLILEKGKTDSDLPLVPGDFIYVSERSIRF